MIGRHTQTILPLHMEVQTTEKQEIMEPQEDHMRSFNKQSIEITITTRKITNSCCFFMYYFSIHKNKKLQKLAKRAYCCRTLTYDFAGQVATFRV